jgi:FMN phosphatase YigB (HAD superfamily)
VALSFDLFGTLVDVERPENPATRVAASLRERGVRPPADFEAAYRTAHVEAPPGAEVSLPTHVAAALRSRGVSADDAVVREAVTAAFDAAVRTESGASEAVRAAAERGPVACLSNCSVPGLASRALERSGVDPAAFDAVVTSLDCGYRKPDRRAFEAVLGRLGADVASLVHVGDDPRTDGGVSVLGGRFVDVSDVALATLARRLRAGATGAALVAPEEGVE